MYVLINPSQLEVSSEKRLIYELSKLHNVFIVFSIFPVKSEEVPDYEPVTSDRMCPEELSPIIYEESIHYDNLISELVELRERLFPHRRDTTNIQKRHKEIEVSMFY